MRRDYVSSRRCLRCACSEPSGPRGYGLARTPTLRWRSSAKLAPSEPVAHGLVLRSRRSSTRRGPCSSMARPSPGNQLRRNDRSTAHQSATLSGCMVPEFVAGTDLFCKRGRPLPTHVGPCPRLLGPPKRTSTPTLYRQGEPPAARRISGVARHAASEIGRRP
jgi:hypothetical protein